MEYKCKQYNKYLQNCKKHNFTKIKTSIYLDKYLCRDKKEDNNENNNNNSNKIKSTKEKVNKSTKIKSQLGLLITNYYIMICDSDL